MNPRTLPIHICLFILLECCSASLLAADYFYRMQITIAGNISVFYVRSKNILEDKNRLLFSKDIPGHLVIWKENPSPGSSHTVINKWYSLPQGYLRLPEIIRGTFPINSEEEGSYVLQPLQTLPPGVTESIEVDNNSYDLLPKILHHLGKQTYKTYQTYGRGRAQEHSWFNWLTGCSYLFGGGEGAGQGASPSGNAGQVVTEQPHSSQQPSNEWRLRWLINGGIKQPSQQWSRLEVLLDTITALSLENAMELVSLTINITTPMLKESSGRDIVLTFRVFLPNNVANEYQARDALGLSSEMPGVLCNAFRLESSDAKNKSEEPEETDL